MCVFLWLFFFFMQKTAYEMRISDWSSDVCSSDPGEAEVLACGGDGGVQPGRPGGAVDEHLAEGRRIGREGRWLTDQGAGRDAIERLLEALRRRILEVSAPCLDAVLPQPLAEGCRDHREPAAGEIGRAHV